MKIAFYSTKSYDKDYFNRFNSNHAISFYETQLNEITVNLINGDECVCVFVNDLLNATTLEALAKKGVKIVALRCAGYNNVDLAKAKQLGIKVVRVPAYSPYSVAEHAVALLQTLNRKIHKAYNRVREGNFNLEHLEGFDLFGKTIGIIGLGHIGKVLVNIMKGYGCKILICDIVKDPTIEGVEYVSLMQLFNNSDIISLHCPLNAETHYIINQKSIEQMKKGVVLVNTGRGGLIDTKAVIEGLKFGKIGGLALDVYEQEGNFFFTDHSNEIIKDEVLLRLMTFPNVIITSHQGFFTVEALTQIAKITLSNIDELVEKGSCVNEL